MCLLSLFHKGQYGISILLLSAYIWINTLWSVWRRVQISIYELLCVEGMCVCLCVWLQCVTVPALFEKLHCTVIISAVDISKLHCIIDIQQWNNLWHLIEYRKILNPLFMYMFLSVIVWKLVLLHDFNQTAWNSVYVFDQHWSHFYKL